MQRLAPQIGAFGGVTDEAVVAAAVPTISHQLGLIERALEDGGQHLAGDFSLADIMVATMVRFVGMTPESTELLGSRPAVSDCVQRVVCRPNFEAAAYKLEI